MSGRPSAATEQALALIKGGMSAYEAATTAGISLSTIYRSKLYKEWRTTLAKPPAKGRRRAK